LQLLQVLLLVVFQLALLLLTMLEEAGKRV